jgi:hypothetical protein
MVRVRVSFLVYYCNKQFVCCDHNIMMYSIVHTTYIPTLAYLWYLVMGVRLICLLRLHSRVGLVPYICTDASCVRPLKNAV